jgi:hypothetical protein
MTAIMAPDLLLLLQLQKVLLFRRPPVHMSLINYRISGLRSPELSTGK